MTSPLASAKKKHPMALWRSGMSGFILVMSMTLTTCQQQQQQQQMTTEEASSPNIFKQQDTGSNGFVLLVTTETIASGCTEQETEEGEATILCPADTVFEMGNQMVLMDADITCPLGKDEDSNVLFDLSPQGLCRCNAVKVPINPSGASIPMDYCNCYTCPLGSKSEFFFECNQPIIDNCATVSCNGECLFLANAPTPPPTNKNSLPTRAPGNSFFLPTLLPAPPTDSSNNGLPTLAPTVAPTPECLRTNDNTTVTCPIQVDLIWNGTKLLIDSEMSCPFTAMEGSDFWTAAKNGLCRCDACDCYACPEGSETGFSFACNQTIIGDCSSFGCNGECNEPAKPGSIPPGCSTLNGTTVVCSVDFDVTDNDGVLQRLDADILCPVDAVRDTDFLTASQQGLCQCAASRNPQDASTARALEPLECNCYACPKGSRLDFSYECNQTIGGDCNSFSCDGKCNEPAKPLMPPTGCVERSGSIACEGNSTVSFNGTSLFIEADLLCPVQDVRRSNFFTTALQPGSCRCDASLVPQNTSMSREPLDCDCYPCPKGSLYDFSFECRKPIVEGACASYSCDGECIALDPSSLVIPGKCWTIDDAVICQATSDFETDELVSRLDANLSCPVEVIQDLDFIKASHDGLCQCDFNLVPEKAALSSLEPLDCDCYACPEGSAYNFSLECNQAIVGECLSFNCDGECNKPAKPILLPSINCSTTTNSVICPANSDIVLNETVLRIDGEISCPIDAVQESDFFAVAQAGKCQCDASLTPGSPSMEREPLSCNCYPCPKGSIHEFSYDCNETIAGNCSSFSCDGECNEPAKPLLIPTNCSKNDGAVVCPVDADIYLNESHVRLEGDLSCSLDFVRDLSFLTASHQEECQCDVGVLTQNISTRQALNCNCYVCPKGSTYEFSYGCNETFVSDCSSFSCDGICNAPANPNQPNGTTEASVITSPAGECFVKEDIVVCPTSSGYGIDGVFVRLQGDFLCPSEAVSETIVPHLDMCSCNATVVPVFPEGDAKTIDCECFVCPNSTGRDFAYQCTEAIVGPCSSYSCGGVCNDPADPSVLGNYTDSNETASSVPSTNSSSTQLDAQGCSAQGDAFVCCSNDTINLSTRSVRLEVEMSCPLDDVQDLNILQVSQQGLCTCATSMVPLTPPGSTESMDCQCFMCADDESSLLRYAYDCGTTKIIGDCTSFSCNGICNGPAGPTPQAIEQSPAPSPNVGAPSVPPSDEKTDSSGSGVVSLSILLVIAEFVLGVGLRL